MNSFWKFLDTVISLVDSLWELLMDGNIAAWLGASLGSILIGYIFIHILMRSVFNLNLGGFDRISIDLPKEDVKPVQSHPDQPGRDRYSIGRRHG